LAASFAAGAGAAGFDSAGFAAGAGSAGLLSLQPARPDNNPATASGTSELDVRIRMEFDRFI
jgi:hypothetical protein